MKIRLSLSVFACAVFVAGCPAAINTTCAIIDVADKACALVRVPLPDGGTEEVQVSREEVQRFATERKSAHAAAAAAADGGAR